MALVLDSKTKTPSADEELSPMMELAVVLSTVVGGCMPKNVVMVAAVASCPLRSFYQFPLRLLVLLYL